MKQHKRNQTTEGVKEELELLPENHKTDPKGTSVWNKFVRIMYGCLPDTTQSAVDHVQSRLQRSSIDNEHRKAEIENLREKTASERLIRISHESLYELDRAMSQETLRSKKLDNDLLEEKLIAQRYERTFDLIKQIKELGLDPSSFLNEQGEVVIHIESIAPKMLNNDDK